MQNALNTFLTPYLLSIAVSTGIGLIIGIEREFRKTNEKDHFAGIRTFPLVAILGCIITFVSNTLSMWLVVGGFLAFMIFISTLYFVRSSAGHSGITTEISLVITFMLGAMTSLQLIKEALAATVITTTLLSLKGKFHSFILKLTEEELFAFIKFIILCMLLFPFLPDVGYGPNGILNPQEIGLIVVTVSSLSFVAYLLIKFVGTNRGILLTAFLGGLLSSTAVTWMFSSRSQKSNPPHTRLYAAGIILASSIMFLRVALTSLIFNKQLFTSLILPCALISITGLAFTFFLTKKEKTPQIPAPVELGNPINILNALGFGLLYVGIALLVYYADKYLGTKGLILSGLISGLADVDAITINMSRLPATTYQSELLVMVIIITAVSNTMVKLGISVVRGSRDIRGVISLAFVSMIVVGMVYVILANVNAGE